MKHTSLLLFLAFTIYATQPLNASVYTDQTARDYDLTYTLNADDGTATLDKCSIIDSRTNGIVIVPEVLTVTDKSGQTSSYTVTAIGEKAFDASGDDQYTFNKKIVEIVLPNSIISIGKAAFYFLENLKKINLPNGITEIGAEAFRYCSAIEEIQFPEELRTIEGIMCSKCESLKTITLGANVERIMDNPDDSNYECSFARTLLQTIHIDATIPPVLEFNKLFTFQSGYTGNITVYIPKGSLEAYQKSWGSDSKLSFVEQENRPSSVETIGRNEVSVQSDGNKLIVNCGDGTQQLIEIISANGATVAREYATSLSVNLPSGIYIVRTGNSTQKVLH